MWQLLPAPGVMGMGGDMPRSVPRTLLISLLAYLAASLFHFAHNAEFLGNYPHMPPWISRADVYAAWIAITAVGVVGYVLFSCEYRKVGLLALAVYAAFGFDGLAHYSLAPMSGHTVTMNLTIWLETATAGLFLITVVGLMAFGRKHDA